MKDVGIKYVEVVPSQTVLEFMGRAQASSTADETDRSSCSRVADSIMLKGEALFSLSRTIKIRGLTVKFKGMATSNFQGTNLQTPILPKLKQVLFAKTTLPPGEHVIPFLLEVPNIYPPSLKSKRATVSYRIELSIAVGLQKKAITAEYPIEVRRHLLRYREMAPLVQTQICQDTFPARFHYEIEAPRIVSLEQGSIPAAVKYLCFASQKSVRAIRTQLRQIEVYSSDGKNVYRKLQYMGDNIIFPAASGSNSISSNNTRNHKRYVKRTVPALLHSVDSDQERSTWVRPIIIRHNLQKQITLTLESPLVTIEHELEVTFQFEHQFENIKAKIPIIITSLPHQLAVPVQPMPKYPFEEKYARLSKATLETSPPERRPHCNQAHLQPQLKYSLDEERLFPRRHEQKVSATGPIRKFASACDLSSMSRRSDDEEDEDDNDNEKPETHQYSEGQEAIKHQHYLAIPQTSKQRQLVSPATSAPDLPISQRRRKRHILRPIDVDLANGTKKAEQFNRKNRARAVSLQLDRVYNESSSTDSSDDNNDCLKSRPPSVVYSAAPGLPASTVLMPQEASSSLPEESFVSDTVHRGDRSPGLATIASSAILSPTTILLDQLYARPSTTAPSLPAQPPPPQSPLPPLPQPRPVGLESLTGDPNPYVNLDLPPIPRPRPQKPSMKAHRMTKLYVEDSDDEVIDPSPPLTHSSAYVALQEQPQHPTLDIMLPRLSLGSEFNLDL
ncbi:hypothetical protein BX666DRAFT_2028583 [Dichotomocladium elegans]|nr:hypothetical protein BX666DRAFT_2028583 [Dichotomocladium elegans]